MGENTSPTFEAAMAELEEVVRKLESGAVPLEESIALYERGAVLKAHCDALLRAAEERIEVIRARDGIAVDSVAADIK